MTGALKGAGFVLLVAFLAFILKEIGFKGARLVAVSGSVSLILLSLGLIDELFSSVSLSLGEGVSDILRSSLKILGVGYVFGIASDICRDMGENGIASAALTVGRVEIFLLCAPYITELYGMLTEVMP